jgi:glycosyltransferase involved in cell wall biosynthesis
VKASVVVPTRGGAQRLPGLLACLAEQTHPDWEAVVVVDGDVDGSVAVLDAAAAHLPVRVVELPENRGRSTALNVGHAAAHGDVLIRCDDDLRPTAGYVAAHVAHHQDAAPVGVVGLYRNVFPETWYARAYGRAWDEEHRHEAYAADPGRRWHYWAGNVSVTRDTWEQVGPYDTGFRSYGYEDVDWGYRLHRLGVPVVLVPALETTHLLAATTTAGRATRAYYSGTARHRFEEKHGIPAAGAPSGLWGAAVRTVAAGLDETRSRRLGALVDRAGTLLPPRARPRGVALAVQAAGLAGHARHDAGRAV